MKSDGVKVNDYSKGDYVLGTQERRLVIIWHHCVCTDSDRIYFIFFLSVIFQRENKKAEKFVETHARKQFAIFQRPEFLAVFSVTQDFSDET